MNNTLFTVIMVLLSFNQVNRNKGKFNDVFEIPSMVEELPLKIGYSIPLGGGKFTLESLKYAKSVGVDLVEVSGMSLFMDDDRNFKMTDDEIIAKLEWVRKNADKAGIKIRSVHMPFGEKIDLSLANETDRKDVVTVQSKLIEFLKILEPNFILFHPSWYLGLNERSKRKIQLLKSARKLNRKVQEINATMVIENMLGPKLLRDKDRESPLLRTVNETVEVMERLPSSIGLAIDFNHIKNPEALILAMGTRLKSLHVNDGTGKQENHYFPCSRKGKQDWVKIFSALENVKYKGPFMYETTMYGDEKKLLECYNTLYSKYLKVSQ